ncbi:MAG TPA: adenylate/guanylate cyclase domain-containing protein [Streptosporangiaceae bacterium]|nr:adenylate/guanylate cyclase domain-containing protein [Streptosporangiaceae bacterium]
MAGAAETRFTRSGDVDIAYQVFGEGERDIVMTMGWVTHLELMWELPELAYFLERLAGLGRVIIFDKRGTGLSDRVPGMVTLEQRAEDVRAVMDAARSERAAFVGWGDGGAIGAMFAATNPERVSALVMSAMTFVTTSTGLGVDPAMMQLMQDTVEQGWGSGNQLDFVAPLHASDPRLRAWWRRWERQSATPNAAATLLRWGAEIDLRPVFQVLQVPTLFLERAGAGLIDANAVRAAAGLTPCARYAEIPGDDVLPFLGDPEPMLGEIEEFLTGARSTADPDRTLSTVLFTDIVGSTATADRVGDREWRNILGSHHAAVRASLSRFGGTEIDTAGDGFLATFAGPARAVRCACDIRDAVAELGLEIRAGLHTGEVERRADSVSGLAVHVGARVAALAAASEVLVTGVVRALVLGSGLSFVDRGTHTLKGVPDSWQLFAVA